MARVLTRDLLHADSAEGFKGGLHFAMGMLAATFTLYNAGAYIVRPSRRLALNTLVYAGLVVLEARQTRCHWQRPGIPS